MNKPEYILGSSIHGFPISHLWYDNDSRNVIRVRTYIQSPDFFPIYVNSSNSVMSNFGTLILSINSKINLGKFVYDQSSGDLFFEIASTSDIKSSGKWKRDVFINLSKEAIRYFLPRILLAAGYISVNEVLTNRDNVYGIPPPALVLMRYMYIKSSQVSGNERELTYGDEDESGVRTKMMDVMIGKVIEKEPGIDNDEFKLLRDILRSHDTYLSPAEIDSLMYISARVMLKEIIIESNETLKYSRLGSISVIYAHCDFFKKGSILIEGVNRNLLSVKCTEASEFEMARNARMILKYLEKQEASYHPNILPHYSIKKASLSDGFYTECLKHGTVERFCKHKRDKIRFALLVVRNVLSAQIFLATRHGIVHLDTVKSNIFISRGMRAKLGYLNKAFVIGEEKLQEMGYKEGKSKYKEKMVYPTNIIASAREIYKENDEISEKTVVFNTATLIMDLVFECEPQVRKRLSESEIIAEHRNETFSLGYKPTDVSRHGMSDILSPLYLFTIACLNSDKKKRPSLIDLSVFISVCSRCLELLYS